MHWSLTRPWTRRELLQQAGSGAGILALTALFQQQGLAATTGQPSNPLAPKVAHFPAKAKS
ncbi:MAG: DUF1501 domain-containing protein, partial [Bryobacteraceae bacterium]